MAKHRTSAKASRKPWWFDHRWSVEAISVRGPKAGEWVEVYSVRTKEGADDLANEWSRKMATPTRVVPGPGHPSKTGLHPIRGALAREALGVQQGKTARELERDIKEVLTPKTASARARVTYGDYLVYANGEFEGQVKTMAGVHRTARKLAKLGLVPSVKRIATDGASSWNEEIPLEGHVPTRRPDVAAPTLRPRLYMPRS